MKRISQTIASILSVIALALVPALAMAPVSVLADTPVQQICNGIGLADNGSGSCGDNGMQFQKVLNNVVNFLSIAIGIAAVLMIVIGGLRFITSGGDANKVTGAKNTIVYALIGLVIVVLAKTIVFFVIGQTPHS